MNPLEVEYKVSLHEGGHGGRWNINKDKGAITFNLPLIYSDAKRIVDKHRLPEDTDAFTEDVTINLFISELIETELIERVCIERAYQKIRMKGRSRCKPFCCVENVALHMHYPDDWSDLKVWINGIRGVKNV